MQSTTVLDTSNTQSRNAQKGNDVAQKIKCHAHNRDGSACKNWAMRGWRVCRLHGARGGRPIIHGLHSMKLKKAFAQRLIENEDNPKTNTLSSNLALVESLLDDLIARIAEKREVSEQDAANLILYSDTKRKLLESIANIEVKNAFTNKHLELLKAELRGFIATLPPEHQLTCIAYLKRTAALNDIPNNLPQLPESTAHIVNAPTIAPDRLE